MRRVILETPYKGNGWKDTQENLRFARLCAHDCLIRDEAPFASHLLYTQRGILDDKIPWERELGIGAGFAWKAMADATVIYINRGISGGMSMGVRQSVIEGQKVEYRNLAAYPKKWRPVIMTITGASGVGKTAIVKRFLAVKPGAKLITSFTSRSPRTSDIHGEYEYNVSKEEFEKRKDEFLWIVPAHGNLYGTSKESVSKTLVAPSIVAPRLMILTPEVIPILYEYLSGYGDYERIVSFYVLSPREEELRKRLLSRGDDEGAIQKRIDDCKAWDQAALQSDIPYIFLSNNKKTFGIEEAVQQMLVFASHINPLKSR